MSGVRGGQLKINACIYSRVSSLESRKCTIDSNAFEFDFLNKSSCKGIWKSRG
jgi:hypothetical protein